MSRVRVTINGVSALMCISNNSNINVLKPEIATRAGLAVQELEDPFLVSYGLGDPRQMQHKVVSVPFQRNNLVDTEDFYVTPDFTIEHFDGILGGVWLHKHTSWGSVSVGESGSGLYDIYVTDATGQKQVLESVPYESGPDRSVWIIAGRLEGQDDPFN